VANQDQGGAGEGQRGAGRDQRGAGQGQGGAGQGQGGAGQGQGGAGRDQRGAGRDQRGADQLGRAREALAAARAEAQGKGLRPSSAGFRPGRQGDAGAGSAEPAGQPGPLIPAPRRGTLRRIRQEDPQALGAAIEGLLDAEGWSQAAATGSVFGRWAEIVGADLAGHTQPESLREGELTVVADSTAWATQLRLLAAQLVHRLNAELGTGTVQRVKVRGPVTAIRKPGEWRVRGSRGPRDTYG
jgi:predicted nucleic acid-binding Zn ribbon protein